MVTMSVSGPRGAKTYEIRWKNGELYDYTDNLQHARKIVSQARAEERAYYRRNPSRRRNLTKSQRVSRRRKASVERRVATALKKFVQAQNPGKKLAGAIVQRMAGGVVKITPIKANRSRRRR